MATAPTPSPTLVDLPRREIRARHMSLRTEDTYVYWARDFIRFHGLRHPREMGAVEVEAYLTMLANCRRVASSTHNQSLSALLFLYRGVLKVGGMGVRSPLDALARPMAAPAAPGFGRRAGDPRGRASPGRSPAAAAGLSGVS